MEMLRFQSFFQVKNGTVFKKTCFKVTVMKAFKICSDCHVKALLLLVVVVVVVVVVFIYLKLTVKKKIYNS